MTPEPKAGARCGSSARRDLCGGPAARPVPTATVMMHEFAFTATSVGRLALSLHQAIKNHRIALPDDEVLLDELISVRLRKNTLGVYRLDHDSGQHDDQAIALALGAHYLLDADGSAESWIRWAREKAIAAGAVIIDGQVTAVPEPPRRPAIAACSRPLKMSMTATFAVAT